MKKVIAIVFCLQILSGNAFAMELTKLPSMVQHYFEHEKEEHPDLSFIDFLIEHYVHEHSDELGGHCDEKIPFKHCNDCCTHSSSVAAFTLPELSSEINSLVYAQFNYPTAPTDFNSEVYVCIWQPPKVG